MQEIKMIPKTPIDERSGPYYIDGVFPIQHRERYREFFTFACYLLALHIPALYENRFTCIRICIRCYNKVHPNLQPNYECKMEWRSIGGGARVQLDVPDMTKHYCNAKEHRNVWTAWNISSITKTG